MMLDTTKNPRVIKSLPCSQSQGWRPVRWCVFLTIALSFLACPLNGLRAQESSLFHQPPTARPPSLVNPTGIEGNAEPGYPLPRSYDTDIEGASWTYTPPTPLRSFRIQDIVTIRVDELARTRADGAAESRRNGLYDAILKDWISLSGGKLGKDQQSTGDPRVTGETTQLFRTDASIESRESLAFSIAARVVDIRPNGSLVLEARKTIRVNDNQWETALSGICRAQDIAPDNVILSRDLLDLQIIKNDKGHLRDGYKRGWLTRWISEFNPF